MAELPLVYALLRPIAGISSMCCAMGFKSNVCIRSCSRVNVEVLRSPVPELLGARGGPMKQITLPVNPIPGREAATLVREAYYASRTSNVMVFAY